MTCHIKKQVGFQSWILPRCQEKVPYPLIFTSNKIIPTKCDIYLSTTYMVIEYGSGCGRIKLKGGKEEFLVQIKYIQRINNTVAIDFSLNVIFFAIK